MLNKTCFRRIRDIPFERQSLLVQEQIATLGGKLDALGIYGGKPWLRYSDYNSLKAIYTRASLHVRGVLRYGHMIAIQDRHNSVYTIWLL